METSVFDREFEITDMDSLKRLIEVMEADVPEPISQHPFSECDRKRGEQLLRQWLLHLKN